MSEKLVLEAIEARERRATPGPWKRQPSLSIDNCVESDARDASGVPEMIADISGLYAREDGDFIAHARTDVSALCAEVRRLREVAEAWRALANARLDHDMAIEPAQRMEAHEMVIAARAKLLTLGIDPDGKEAW